MPEFAWAAGTTREEVVGVTRPETIKDLVKSSKPVWGRLYEAWLSETGLGGENGVAAFRFLKAGGTADKKATKDWTDYLAASYKRFYDDVGLLKSYLKDNVRVEAGGDSSAELLSQCDEVSARVLQLVASDGPAASMFVGYIELEDSFPKHVDWLNDVIDEQFQEIIEAWRKSTRPVGTFVTRWQTERPQLVAIVDAQKKAKMIQDTLDRLSAIVQGILDAIAAGLEAIKGVSDRFTDRMETAIRLELRAHFEEIHPTAALIMNLVNKAVSVTSLAVGIASVCGGVSAPGALAAGIVFGVTKLALFATKEIMIALDSQDPEKRQWALEQVDISSLRGRGQEAYEYTMAAVDVVGGGVGGGLGFTGVITDSTGLLMDASQTGAGLIIDKVAERGFEDEQRLPGPRVSGQDLVTMSEGVRGHAAGQVDEAMNVDWQFIGRGKDHDQVPYNLGWSGGELTKQYLGTTTSGDRVAGGLMVVPCAWLEDYGGQPGWLWPEGSFRPTVDFAEPPEYPEDGAIGERPPEAEILEQMSDQIEQVDYEDNREGATEEEWRSS